MYSVVDCLTANSWEEYPCLAANRNQQCLMLRTLVNRWWLGPSLLFLKEGDWCQVLSIWHVFWYSAPPKASIDTPTLTVVEGKQAEFTCRATGDLPLMFSWVSTEESASVLPMINNFTRGLTIDNVQQSRHNGLNVTCEVRNPDLVDKTQMLSTASARLIVQGKYIKHLIWSAWADWVFSPELQEKAASTVLLLRCSVLCIWVCKGWTADSEPDNTFSHLCWLPEAESLFSIWCVIAYLDEVLSGNQQIKLWQITLVQGLTGHWCILRHLHCWNDTLLWPSQTSITQFSHGPV